MAITSTDIQTALANEARRQELRQKLAGLRGGADATASLMQRIMSLNNDQQKQIQDTSNTLIAFEAGAAPGVTQDFGPKSTITQMIETERYAAKAAVVDFVKNNPTTATEEQAVAAWNQAGLATHPEFTQIIQDGYVMGALYRANLVSAGLIANNSWTAFRDWVSATPVASILAL